MNWIINFKMFRLQNCHGQKMFWVKTNFVTHVRCKICTKVMGKKNFLFPSLILFVNMLVGRKLLPPCSMFLKVYSIMLKIVNMLKMKCFMFPKVWKMFWTRLCKVWHMRVWRKSFNLSQFSTYSKRETQCLNMKAWKICYSSFKWIIVHRNICGTLYIGLWLK